LKSAKLGAAFMALLILMYLVLLGERSLLLIATGQPIAVAIGGFMLVLPVFAIWALAKELQFGLAIERLGKGLLETNGWPEFDFELRPSGRPTKESALRVFEEIRNQVQENPENWQVWFKLGLAYDAAGDRSRGRSAMRRAIKLEKSPTA
jgi:hypothetical protein